MPGKVIIGKNTKWMTLEEYEAFRAKMRESSLEEQKRMSYYLHNNLSYEGYERYATEQAKVQAKQSKSQL